MNTTRQDAAQQGPEGDSTEVGPAARRRPLSAFMHISVDGYFADVNGDMSFAHRLAPDPEWDAYVGGNAGAGSTLLFGRRTYELMAGFWPTPAALEMMPDVARGMNAMEKVVFSRTLRTAGWSNTTVHNDDLVETVRSIRAASTTAVSSSTTGCPAAARPDAEDRRPVAHRATDRHDSSLTDCTDVRTACTRITYTREAGGDLSNEREWEIGPGPGLMSMLSAAATAGAGTRIVLLDDEEDGAWTDADEEEDEDLDELDDLDDDDDDDLDDEDWEDDEDWDDDLDEDEDEEEL